MCNIGKKGGYSLAEVVIALSLIVLVSIATVSVVLSSASARANVIHKRTAQNFADNVWECFKAAETKDEFLSLIAFSEEVALTESPDDASVYTYHSEENRFSAQIRALFSEAGKDELEISLTDGNGEELLSFSYQKEN